MLLILILNCILLYLYVPKAPDASSLCFFFLAISLICCCAMPCHQDLGESAPGPRAGLVVQQNQLQLMLSDILSLFSSTCFTYTLHPSSILTPESLYFGIRTSTSQLAPRPSFLDDALRALPPRRHNNSFAIIGLLRHAFSDLLFTTRYSAIAANMPPPCLALNRSS